MRMNAVLNRNPEVRATVRRLIETASMVVWESDTAGNCTYLNPEAMQGLSCASDVHVNDWLAHIHAEDAVHAIGAIRTARSNRHQYQVEYRIACTDGSTRWVSETAAPRCAPDGRLLGYIGTLVDVSEKHEVRTRLMRSEIEHRLLTENARDLISYSDADNIYLYVSPSHKDTLGYEPHELVGTHLYDYIHPDDLTRDAVRPKGVRPGLVNIRFRHKNGQWVWLGASTRTVRDPQTGAKMGVVSVARDITAQLEAGRELARREERFRSLTSLSSDWYWETDERIRFSFLSEGIYQRLGQRASQLLGTRYEEYAADPRASGYIACVESINTRRPFHDLIFPVRSIEVPGAVRFLRISGEPFSEDGVFRGYRGVSRDVTQEVRTANALEHLATRDTLTELPNRELLQRRLRQCLEDRDPEAMLAVFFIDLDNFKEINDSLGHAAGDSLLKDIAVRLKRCVRPDDTVGRLGGDEFVVLAECKFGDTSAVRLADKLCKALDQPAVIMGHEVRVSGSIGISMYPQDGDTCDVLLQNADTALYRAKATGGNCFRFYTPDMSAASRTRMVRHAALRHALERDEFVVHYQPRVDLKTLRLTGVEALLRWTHPELGAVSPADFIPLAEESGMIDEITDWVLQRATEQVQAWTARYGYPLTISVNLSARQLRNKKILDAVVHALSRSGLHPGQLELELTESALMEDADAAAVLLKELKSLGLRLSVDDFGTGYSSLAYLRRFPLDCLKLDRSFLTQNHQDEVSPWKLAEAIIKLAHTLNLSVVAEGVESAEHLVFLRTTACDEIQGACISEPIPAAEIEKLLRKTIAIPVTA